MRIGPRLAAADEDTYRAVVAALADLPYWSGDGTALSRTLELPPGNRLKVERSGTKVDMTEVLRKNRIWVTCQTDDDLPYVLK